MSSSGKKMALILTAMSHDFAVTELVIAALYVFNTQRKKIKVVTVVS